MRKKTLSDVADIEMDSPPRATQRRPSAVRQVASPIDAPAELGQPLCWKGVTIADPEQDNEQVLTELDELRRLLQEPTTPEPPPASGQRGVGSGVTLLRAVLDSMTHGVALADATGGLVLVNRAAEAMLGCALGELRGRSLLDLTRPDDAEEMTLHMQRLLDGSTDFHRLERRYRRRSGDDVWLELSIRPIVEPHGAVRALLCILMDITERQRGQEALRESESRYRLLVENVPVGIVATDVDGSIVDVNPALLSILGSPSPEATRRINMLTFPPLLEAGVSADVARCLETGEPIVAERPYVSEWAKTVQLLYHVTPIRDGEGRITGCQVVFEDMTAIRKVETEGARLEAQLLQTQKMEAIGHLAGGVAHDMNNVLGVVMAEASLLQASLDKDDPQREGVDNMLTACRRGRDLTRNLLGFARKGRYVRSRVSLNEIVLRTIELLARILRRKISIETDLDDELCHVEGDRSQLSQALMNVCLNAADAMATGGTLTITTHNVMLDAGREQSTGLAAGQYSRVQVIDTGVGMDRRTAERAIEPFFSTKPEGEGTGLGLSMAYGTIRNHGGALQVDSEPNAGTTIAWLLPALESDPDAAVQGSEPVPAGEPGVGVVLLVDDEELIRSAARRVLEQAGYTVLLAEHGQAAVDLYRDRMADIGLVVLDMIMPVMGGRETFRQLSEMNPAVRVLVCSGYGKDADVEALLSEGAAGFLQKPFAAGELSAAVAAALE